MKTKLIYILIGLAVNFSGLAQNKNFLKSDSLKNNQIIKIDDYSESVKSYEFKQIVKNRNRNYINGIEMAQELIKLEKSTLFETSINASTREYIYTISKPYILRTLQYTFINAEDSLTKLENLEKLQFDNYKRKIIPEIMHQTESLLEKMYPMYGYGYDKKRLIRLFSLNSGNDLFGIIGAFGFLVKDKSKNEIGEKLGLAKYIGPLTANNDREYTGSLNAEIATDFFDLKRKFPVLHYQTIGWGFDVWTPNFRDPIFNTDSTFSKFDRPHGAFGFVSYNRYCLSKSTNHRWANRIKIGRIGGSIGEKFQTTLHQDLSNSKTPRGWDVQIANGRRLGVSLETNHDWQDFFQKSNVNKKIHYFGTLGAKLGNYMTNASAGIGISNKRFDQNNHHNLNIRSKYTVKGLEYFTYNFSYNIIGVVHNSMLEGFGYFAQLENSVGNQDDVANKSKYYFNKKGEDYPGRINRITQNFKIGLSYQTTFATIFYNWFAFSPEYRINENEISKERMKANPKIPWSTNLSKKWHQFAQIGINFKIN